ATVAKNLTNLKHALRDLIVEVVGPPNTVETDPSILAARAVDLLAREDIPVGDECGGFGAIEGINFQRPQTYPDWLISTTSLSIPYGSDVSLYLFEKEGTSWKHALTLESNGYKTIHDAQGWLEYRVAPPIPSTKPYLVTTEVSPNVVSVWQALRLSVLRVGEKPEAPVVLATRTLGYCLDEPYYLSVRASGFGLIYLGSSVNPELAGWRGVHYLEYAVSNKNATIVRDFAVDPFDLIQNWVGENWTVASRRVSPPARDSFHEWHQRFQKSRWACGLGQIHLGRQLEGDYEQLLAEAGCEEGDDESQSAHVLLEPGRSGFQIASISGKESEFGDKAGGYTVYSAGQAGLTDPLPLTIVQPKLPENIRASVTTPVKLRLSIVVEEDGSIGSVCNIDWPKDQLRIVMPAIQAVRQWRYKPGMKDGKPVKVALDIEAVFER
ncbi:MAG TPA: energy transducer TonB, partial [Terriglobia bacterium]|nr:energy transducer TonB [Terriglobia bacterium]